MVKKLVLFLLMLAGCWQMGSATVNDDWKPVSADKAVAFVQEFYSHRSMENGQWEDAVLEKYLAPAVLKTLAEAASDSEKKYASWLLSGTDDSEMILPSVQLHDPVALDDGRVMRELGVFYWADTWLRSTQTLYFTVKSKGGRLYITQVDNMNGEAAADVWAQLEARNEAREMEAEDEAEVEEDNPLLESAGKIGPYDITFFRNPADMGEGDEVGYYYYNERPNSIFKLILVENTAINAKGSMHVVLKEYTANGNHTGTFDGQYESRGGGYEGTFTNSKGDKFHFELMEK
jgi:hypothetical protein